MASPAFHPDLYTLIILQVQSVWLYQTAAVREQGRISFLIIRSPTFPAPIRGRVIITQHVKNYNSRRRESHEDTGRILEHREYAGSYG